MSVDAPLRPEITDNEPDWFAEYAMYLGVEEPAASVQLGDDLSGLPEWERELLVIADDSAEDAAPQTNVPLADAKDPAREHYLRRRTDIQDHGTRGTKRDNFRWDLWGNETRKSASREREDRLARHAKLDSGYEDVAEPDEGLNLPPPKRWAKTAYSYQPAPRELTPKSMRSTDMRDRIADWLAREIEQGRMSPEEARKQYLAELERLDRKEAARALGAMSSWQHKPR